jgi:hypothetical protein
MIKVHYMHAWKYHNETSHFAQIIHANKKQEKGPSSTSSPQASQLTIRCFPQTPVSWGGLTVHTVQCDSQLSAAVAKYLRKSPERWKDLFQLFVSEISVNWLSCFWAYGEAEDHGR